MQSIENTIQTDLIYTALSIAGGHLKKKGAVDSGPYSELGLIKRAKKQREKEIRRLALIGSR